MGSFADLGRDRGCIAVIDCRRPTRLAGIDDGAAPALMPLPERLYRLGAAVPHLPMQNVENMRPSRSSEVNSPVISPRQSWA